MYWMEICNKHIWLQDTRCIVESRTGGCLENWTLEGKINQGKLQQVDWEREENEERKKEERKEERKEEKIK